MLLRRRSVIFLGLMALNLIVKNENNGSKKDNINQLNLPSFTNTFIVKSSMRGRIRFEAPILKNNKTLAELLISQLKGLDVIKKASINMVLGTIVVEYDETKIDGQTIEGVLMRFLKLDQALDNRISTIRQKCKDSINAINNGIYDYTKGLLDIKTIALLYFVLGAIIDFKRNGRHGVPDYTTLLWWSSSLFA